MAGSERQTWSCPDCGGSLPLSETSHDCWQAGRRRAAELLDGFIMSFGDPVYKSACFSQPLTGAGLLWLYRIAYRVRSRMNGLEKYKDRAEMARLACELGGGLVK